MNKTAKDDRITELLADRERIGTKALYWQERAEIYRTTTSEALHVICRLLMSASFNRFGKPEWNDPLAREDLRLLAVRYNVGPSDTIIEQAGKVASAALAKAVV